MVDCRMLQGPLAGQIVSIAAEDAAAALNDGWAEPVILFNSYPWPWNVNRADITTPNPPSYDEWVEAGSPPGAPHGPPQPLDPPVLSSISPTSAKLGTIPYAVTLTGSKFTPMSKAFFQPAGFPETEVETAFVSATELTANVTYEPAAAGDVGIVVRQGDNVTDAQTFTFDPADPPPNTAPTDITLTPNTVPANSVETDYVGDLASVDPDDGDTFTYALVNDNGGMFSLLSGNKIYVGPTPLVEGAQTIRVSSTDSGSNAFEKDLTITVTAPVAEE